jgi:hypothetical protein
MLLGIQRLEEVERQQERLVWKENADAQQEERHVRHDRSAIVMCVIDLDLVKHHVAIDYQRWQCIGLLP